jgi:hypothetical protein
MSKHHHNNPMSGLADSLGLIVPNSSQFLGKSGEGMLVQTAVEFRKEYTGDVDEGMMGNPEKSGPKNRRDNFWDDKPVRYTICISFALLKSF